MNWNEFIASRATAEPRLCGCGCGKPLEPRVDGERHQIDGVEVQSDCYFRELGKLIDESQIGIRRPPRS